MAQNSGPSLENELNTYRTIQKEIGKVQSQVGTAQTQILENEMVLKVRAITRASFTFPYCAAPFSRFISPFIRFSSAHTQELDLLEEDSSVFKLIGPVLVKQELVEVKNNVTKRVEFIKNDISRLEGTIKKFEKQSETVKGNIAALQKSGKQ